MKKVLVFVLKLAITGLVFLWIDRTFGFSQISQTLAGADFRWFFGAIFLQVLSIFIGAWQWGIILRNRGLRMGKFETLKLYYTGTFFNNFIFGTIAGDSFKVAVLYKKKKQAKSGFAATFLDRFAGLAVLSIFAVVGAVIMLGLKSYSGEYLHTAMLILLFFLLVLIAVCFVLFSKRVQKLFSKILLKFPQSNIAKKIENIVSSVYLDKKRKADLRMFRRIFGLSFLIQGLRICAHIFCAAAIGVFAFNTAHYFFIIIPITAILMLVPLPFGVIPAIAGAIFAAAGFDAQQATVMQFLAAIAGVIGSLAGAVFFLTDNKGDSRATVASH
ncbi:MAG: flippase-like domain-containing protein [Chitinivibrionia bacterium]|nr:flippase-like domain-containing protein [Chitinivibrionia bacterium]